MEEEIKNDVRFNYINKKYGLDINNIEIINLDNDYVIINHFKNSEIYILFDKNYNVFSVSNLGNIKSYEELYNKVLAIYNYYLVTPDGITTLFNFPYPFQDFTLKDILDLSSKIGVMKFDYSLNLVSGKDDDLNYQTEVRLLSYIKFLSIEIEKYFKYSYQMQMINLDVPNVYLYVISLINKIEKYLTDPKTSYQDISSYLGNVNTEHDLSYLLTDIHELLCHNNQDLDILANKLLNKNKDKTLKKTIK